MIESTTQIQTKPRRLKEIDLLKGFGIILVLLGHSYVPGWLFTLIYGFHMPLFFFVAGIFYKKQPTTITIRKSFYQLIIPWIFFVCIEVLVFCLMWSISLRSISNGINYTIENIDFLGRESMTYLAIWFLICLFFIRVLYSCIDNLIHSQWIKIIIFITGYIIVPYLHIPFFIDTAIGSIIFYSASKI